MKLVKIVSVAALAVAALAVAAKAACPAYPSCPLDGAQLMRVGTEYQGITQIGIYEHTTTTGEHHRYEIRCN
jgi:hypothetical protein